MCYLWAQMLCCQSVFEVKGECRQQKPESCNLEWSVTQSYAVDLDSALGRTQQHPFSQDTRSQIEKTGPYLDESSHGMLHF